MNEIIERLGLCVERGKVNKAAPFPQNMRGEDGADELARLALELSVEPGELLQACMDGMHRVGERFTRNEIFIPEMLMSAKAMKTVMVHLKPFFQSGSVKTKGKFILGTVAGDLHDIGKNLVMMVVEGNGWQVLDLGVDVAPAKFIQVIESNPGCVVGLSALLTTTMMNMSSTVKEIKARFPETKIIVGGAPLSTEAAKAMGADSYGRDPQSAVTFLDGLVN